MARKSFKAGALTAPLPPVMVTVGSGESANVITIAWTGILSTIPPRTYISVRPQRHSYKLLRESGEFVINLPTASLARTVDYVGIYTGAKVNKWKECGLTPTPSEKVAAPTIAECPFALECRVCEVIPMGTHDVFIADIVSVSADESILDEDGRLCFDRADLLAYAHGEYFALGEKLGKFGFSATKPKKRKSKPNRDKSAEADALAAEPEKSNAVTNTSTAATEATDPDNRTATQQTPPFYLTAPRGKRGKPHKGGTKGARSARAPRANSAAKPPKGGKKPSSKRGKTK